MNRHGVLLLATATLVAAPLALAENIDPANDGSQYALAENIGWLNAQPIAPGGAGMHVGDLDVTGYVWAENAGWISLSCLNSSCVMADWRVRNDLAGRLSGFAWGENTGWVNFAPLGVPVTIDRPTGKLTGRAWGENVGWITFSASSPVAYAVKTSWCLPAPSIPPIPTLHARRVASGFEIYWGTIGPNTYFDAVRGVVSKLRANGGSFAQATDTCIASHTPSLSAAVNEAVAPGEANWYLLRSANCGGDGSYDNPSGGQVAPRDGEIAASGSGCP